MKIGIPYRQLRLVGFAALLAVMASSVGAATPAGYVKRTIALNAPPVGLTFDGDGLLYALEAPEFGSNQATIRMFQPDGTPSGSIPIVGDDSESLYIDELTYDHVGDRLLVSDNAGDGRLYAISNTGAQTTIATGITFISGVAVRDSGEIFLSTANGNGNGSVLLYDRVTGQTSPVAGGLDYGAGLAFDINGHLLVQDAVADFSGRLHRIPIAETPSGLTFGTAQFILDGMQSSFGVAVDGEGDIFATGKIGVHAVAESPAAETLFYTDGSGAPIATTIAFNAGTQPFEPFAGPGGGTLAFNADFGFVKNDLFVTLLTPAVPGDYDGNGNVNGADYAVWKSAYGTNDPHADGNLDGIVDAVDYTVWRNHLGLSLGTGGIAATIVPEPSASKLASLTFVFVLGWAARARSTEPLTFTWRDCS